MSQKLRTVAIVFFALLICTTAFGEKFKKYKNKSGMIEYKLSGNSEGKSVTYWDDYGYKEVQISNTTTKVWGMTTEEKKTSVTLGKYMYEWKEGGEEVFRSENPIAEMWEEENYDAKDVEDFGKETMTQMGYEKIGEEKVDGKNCEVWDGIGKIWIWKKNGIALKTDVKMMGINIVSTATDIKLDVKVDKDLFKYPKDLPIVDEDTAPEYYGNDENSDGSSNGEEIDINAFKKALKAASAGVEDGGEEEEPTKKEKELKKQSDSEDNNEEEGDFSEELKEAAKESAKEGAKEETKEQTKKASKKAAKKMIKGLFGK